MMRGLQGLWEISLASLQLLVAPPIFILTTLIFISLCWAAPIQGQPEKGLWKPHHRWVFLQFLFFPAMIALALLFPNDTDRFSRTYPYGSAALVALHGLFLGSVALSAFWIWWMKGVRWLAFSIVALMELAIAGAFFVAGLTVTGEAI